jgi:hypothetical protein
LNSRKRPSAAISISGNMICTASAMDRCHGVAPM